MRLARALTFFFLIACVGRAYGADPTAITGVALDAQGLALPGVTVTLKADGAPSDPQEQITDAEGRFTFGELAAGSYTVVLSLSGFADKTFDAVKVPAEIELKATLQLAAFTETVIVRPEPS